ARSGKRWPATSAGAPATRRSWKPWRLPPVADLKVVGKAFPKADAAAKVIGSAVYADDIALPRMLHCRILRSPHPHARILSVDATAASRIPGVQAVITGEDLPIRFGILPVSQDERALEGAKVRYVGDPVPAVVAGGAE